MPSRQSFLLFLVVQMCLLLGVPPQPSAEPQNPTQAASGRSKRKYVEGQLLVRFRAVDKGAMDAAHQQFRATPKKDFPLVPNLQLIEIPMGESVEKAVAAYRMNPAVLYAEPNYLYQASQQQATPNDPRFPEMWGLHNTGQLGGRVDADIDAPEAWAITTGSSNIVVGVIDTGIDYTHPDLMANMFQNTADCNSNGVDDDGNGFVDDCFGINPVYGTSDPMDDHGHGTHVAGTIGAVGNNGVGVAGVNWNVRLMACKFLDADGFGSTSGAITCLQYFATMYDRGVNLVATNNSWGGGGFSSALRDAIHENRQRGILFIAAAGNAGSNNDLVPQYPSSYYLPNVISVAASDRNDNPASFSNFGPRTVHLAAPGVSILSTLPGNSYGTASGTSMASPHVAGAAALLKAQDPNRDWKTIKNLLLTGGETAPGGASTISGRRLNAHGALTCSGSTLRRLLLPISTPTAVVGVPLDLAMLHINCASPNGALQVLVDGGAQTVSLLDDGLGSDQEPDDGIYSGQWIPATTGTHMLELPGGIILQVQVISPYVPSAPGSTYRNISGTRIDLPEDSSTELSLAFPIRFGGGSFTTLFINENGNLTLSQSFTAFSNQALPVSTASALVTPFWGDLTADNGGIFYQVTGTTPNRELVIEWRNYGLWECDFGDAITFQVVLSESSSDILFNYLDTDLTTCPVSAGASATVGVQVAQGVATQFSFRSPSVPSGTTILWQLGFPSPVVTSISPFDAVAGDPGFTLKVKGTGFLSNSVVRWNGSDRATTFANSTEVSAMISATHLTTPGTAQVTVFNPAPSPGSESAPAPFEILSARAVPVLSTVTPGSVFSGSSGLVLNATGTGFHSASMMRWNGADLVTTVTNSTSLSAEIPVSSLAVLGPAQVTIFNPPPGGGESNPVTVDVNNPVPVAQFLFPDPAIVGANFTLTVFGEGFSQTSVVRWNGGNRPTTFRSSSLLEASISAADVATPGTVGITVFNPAPGGGLSSPVILRIVPPAPNNDFVNSIVISGVPFSHTVQTEAATSEPTDPPPCGIGSTQNSVWYTFTVPAGATINVNTFGSDYDTVLSAWTGGPGSFVPVACNDDSGVVGGPSSLRITRSTQTTLHFMVTDFFFGGGSLIFNLDIEPSFTMTSSVPSVTLQRGQSANVTLTVSQQFGTLNNPVSFSCLGPPVGIACAFAPQQVMVGTTPATTTLTITSTAQARMAPPGAAPLEFAAWIALPAMGLLAAPWAGPWRRKALLRFCLLLFVVAVLGGGSAGCGGGGGGGGGGGNVNPPAQTINVTVNANSGMISANTTIVVTVR